MKSICLDSKEGVVCSDQERPKLYQVKLFAITVRKSQLEVDSNIANGRKRVEKEMSALKKLIRMILKCKFILKVLVLLPKT